MPVHMDRMEKIWRMGRWIDRWRLSLLWWLVSLVVLFLSVRCLFLPRSWRFLRLIPFSVSISFRPHDVNVLSLFPALTLVVVGITSIFSSPLAYYTQRRELTRAFILLG